MKIITISDTHNRHDEIQVPDGDIVLFAGDCSGRGSYYDVENFVKWYGNLPHAYKIMIAGNHDLGFEEDPLRFEKLCTDNNVIYLNDTSITILGIKIHGSPITPTFCDWAFNRSRTIEESMTQRAQIMGQFYIGNNWDLIPDDTDILITHGPPADILDETLRGDSTGCEVLRQHIEKKTNIKMHVFGHIHEAKHVEIRFDCRDDRSPVTFVNASSLNAHYDPYLRKTFVFDWDEVVKGKSFGTDYDN